MAEFLGKPRIKKEDISKYMLSQKVLVQDFLDEMKPRIKNTLEHDIFKRFEYALVRKYGEFSPTNVEKAVQATILEWLDKLDKNE